MPEQQPQTIATWDGIVAAAVAGTWSGPNGVDANLSFFAADSSAFLYATNRTLRMGIFSSDTDMQDLGASYLAITKLDIERQDIPPVFTRLTDLLSSEAENVQLRAAIALITHGFSPEIVVSKLEALSNHPDPIINGPAKKCLEQWRQNAKKE